jgi:trimeric autotransporter adhesin
MLNLRWSVLLLAALLGSCAGIGDGNKPESLSVIPTLGRDAEGFRAFMCFRDNVQVLARFTNGLVGDFTNRVTYRSSNTGVLQVSNGDQAAPDRPGFFFSRGTISPVALGTATITVEFADLRASLDVRVVEPDFIRVTPKRSGGQSVAVGSTQQFTATTAFDGAEADVTQLATWSLVDPGNTDAPVESSIASILRLTGLLTATTAGGPFTVKANFSACQSDGRNLPTTVAATDLETEINIKPLTAIELTREFSSPDNTIVTRTSEAFTVTGRFNSDSTDTQDLTTQATYSFNDPMPPTDGSVRAIFFPLRNILTATLETDPVNPLQVRACFGNIVLGQSAADNARICFRDPQDADAPDFFSNTFNLAAVNGTIQSLAITPADAVVAKFQPQQYTATGTYDVVGGQRTQQVNRHVTWASSRTSVATISNLAGTAGRALTQTDVAGCTLISAQQNQFVDGQFARDADGNIIVITGQTRLFAISNNSGGDPDACPAPASSP